MTSLDKPHPPPLTSLLRLTRSSIKGIFRRADMIVDRAFEVCDSDSHLIGSFRFWCRPFSLVACLENKCVYFEIFLKTFSNIKQFILCLVQWNLLYKIHLYHLINKHSDEIMDVRSNVWKILSGISHSLRIVTKKMCIQINWQFALTKKGLQFFWYLFLCVHVSWDMMRAKKH